MMSENVSRESPVENWLADETTRKNVQSTRQHFNNTTSAIRGRTVGPTVFTRVPTIPNGGARRSENEAACESERESKSLAARKRRGERKKDREKERERLEDLPAVVHETCAREADREGDRNTERPPGRGRREREG